MSSISSVSSSVSVSTSSGSGSIDQLEKQKADLRKQIAAEQTSKDDDKTKLLKIAQLQKQVQAIDAELQAEQAKANKPNAESAGKSDKKQRSKLPDPDPTKVLDTTI